MRLDANKLVTLRADITNLLALRAFGKQDDPGLKWVVRRLDDILETADDSIPADE